MSGSQSRKVHPDHQVVLVQTNLICAQLSPIITVHNRLFGQEKFDTGTATVCCDSNINARLGIPGNLNFKLQTYG